MAWDTEATRGRLLEAATVEFADHGLDGTTMSAIAERAGINKERLYNYFGDKRALFATVLSAELAALSAAVVPPETGLEDIGEFAGRTFDYYSEHPRLARLLLWEGLAGGPPAREGERTTHYRDKAETYAQAQRDGVLAGDLDPAHLVFFIIGLAAWWFSVPQLAQMLTGTTNADPAERARRRSAVVHAARRLAQLPPHQP